MEKNGSSSSPRRNSVWLMLIGLCGLLYGVREFYNNFSSFRITYFVVPYQEGIRTSVLSDFIFPQGLYTLLGLSLVASGIGVLFKQAWARIIFIVTILVNFTYSFIITILSLPKTDFSKIFLAFNPEYSKYYWESRVALSMVISIAELLLMIIFVIYLIRPKVTKLFKKELRMKVIVIILILLICLPLFDYVSIAIRAKKGNDIYWLSAYDKGNISQNEYEIHKKQNSFLKILLRPIKVLTTL